MRTAQGFLQSSFAPFCAAENDFPTLQFIRQFIYVYFFVPVDITPIYGNESLNLTIFNNKYPFTLSCKVTGDTNHEIEIKW